MSNLEKFAVLLIGLAFIMNVHAFGPQSAQPTLGDADVQNGDAMYVSKQDHGYHYTRIIELP